MMARPAVFLDRDGVINNSVVRDGRPYPPADLDEFRILPGVAEALERLRQAGFATVIVTNQPDVATGKQDRAVVEAMHRLILESLAIDRIYACFEQDGPGCRCYKPKPGMLLDAAFDLALDLEASYMVGDRWRDVGAGKAAGCFTIFIDYGYDERCPDPPDAVASSLADAADLILKRDHDHHQDS